VPQTTDALAGALARIGDRWSLLVIDALMDGPLRFADLQRDVPGIATNVLTHRLRHLESHRLVVASPYSGRPPRYSYSLTQSGRALAGAMHLLAQWSAEHGEASVEVPRHDTCGTALQARWWCPTCDQPVDTGDESVWV
jgi:DNA-binding HxlR family transcriptional regulator